MARRATSPVLIGRANERAALDAAFEVASTGAAVPVLVVGEAGIGKSRLVAEFLRDVGTEATVLVGGCCDDRVPYGPVTAALRSLLQGSWRPGGASAAWASSARSCPSCASRPDGADPRAAPGSLHDDVLRLLDDAARDRPVILVVGDLHWSDASTRNLLLSVLRGARGMPLLVVGTYRDDDLTRRHALRPFLAEVVRLPTVGVIELGRLEIADVARIMAEILGGPPEPASVDNIHARCGGNPFLVEELLAAGADHGSRRLPQRLQDILLARTATISSDAMEVLRTAAVGGSRIDDALLRSVSPLAPEVLDVALRELLDAHLLELDGEGIGYAFRHALTAEAVYDDALPGERVRLHASLARAIGDAPELASAGRVLAAVERAQHWHLARRVVEALPAWVDAATSAEGVYAYPEALAAYESALELWAAVPDARDRVGFDEVELLRRAAEAANWSGVAPRARSLAEHALALVEESQEPLRASMLMERLGRYTWAAGHERDALVCYERAVELTRDQPASVEQARALAGHAQILMLNWIDTAALERAREAIVAARRAGTWAVEAHALSTLALAEASAGDEAAALAAMEQSSRLTELCGDDESVWRLWVNRVYLLAGLGRIEEAATVAPRGRTILRELGLARGAGAHFAANHASPLVELGRWDEAYEILDEELARDAPSWWRGVPLQAHAWLSWVTGDLEAAEQDLEEVARQSPELVEGQFVAPQAQVSAVMAIASQQWEAAVQTVAAAVSRLPVEGGAPVVHWEMMTALWPGLWAAAELVREQGEVGSAWLAPHLAEMDRLLAAAAAWRPARRTVRERALLALCRVERARIEKTDSSADWVEAVVALDALGAVPLRAYARVRLAEALLAEQGRRAAADALGTAVGLLAGAPGSPIRMLATQVARRARLRLAEPSDSARDPEVVELGGARSVALTKREGDVLRLLAESRTNREIGEALFISPKTASVHVSAVMRKLGVKRRADAARFARRMANEHHLAPVARP